MSHYPHSLIGGGGGPHTHPESDIVNLISDLAGKASTGHNHSDATTSVSGFMSGADKTKLNGVATGATANDTDANLKARGNHTGTQSLDTTTDSATRLAMTAAERTKLGGIATGATANSSDATLLNRANHTGTQAASTISDFSEAVDDRVAALLLQGANVTLTYNDGANSLTVAASGGGGADPWTYIKLASDFVTSSATAVAVTGMAFTPSANTSYEFEAHLLCRTATATVGPRPGVGWPTGGTDGVASIYTPSAAATEVMQHGNINAAVLGPVGGLPNTTQSYGAKIVGLFIAGASPSGTVKLQLASETAGTNVTIKAGSFLKYRSI